MGKMQKVKIRYHKTSFSNTASSADSFRASRLKNAFFLHLLTFVKIQKEPIKQF